MLSLLAPLCLVPLVDQTLKVWLRARLKDRVCSLGPLGCLHVVESRIWLQRVQPAPRWAWLGLGWGVCAAVLVMAIGLIPFRVANFAAGLLLGGSLSHLLETAVRGRVTDYVCLRFWPAFNLADAAVTVGGLGLLLTCVRLASEALR